MPLTVRPRRRRFASVLTAITAFAVLVGGFPTAAAAEPNEIPNAKVAKVRQNLETVAGQYIEAEAALEKSKKDQQATNLKLVVAENRYERARISVVKYAAEAYKTGRLGVFETMLNATTSDAFLQRMAALERMAARDEAILGELVATRKEADEAKAIIDAEVKKQAKLFKDLAALRKAAERELSALGGYATNGWVDPTSPLAIPAKRNSDGSWPKETCSINDPTTNGCITPRTLHAMQEAKKAGFKRYVSCYRPGDMYEHPKGRACDFSTEVDGFHDYGATGDSKLYGSKLAAFYVKNASRLGIMYVIFYCQVWTVGSGWHRYSATGSNCGDSPAGDHTNHVHVSVY
ncbi:hypothetical protein QEZ54_03660 [Catellatospora sp. KI3]|uniref:coiled-coil domain-containing protein n=1 Tax=Catellatospora sp. KI3 TaxID=3041620 RepID=UPI002482CEB2|nr:hypothetical protein [Catellatospora sp. KI3]MDI1460055.1 hypothetical protein [Catellatospora sp. KI3]